MRLYCSNLSAILHVRMTFKRRLGKKGCYLAPQTVIQLTGRTSLISAIYLLNTVHSHSV